MKAVSCFSKEFSAKNFYIQEEKEHNGDKYSLASRADLASIVWIEKVQSTNKGLLFKKLHKAHKTFIF